VGALKASTYSVEQDLGASSAITQLHYEGWFALERQCSFDYFWYWDTPDEFQAFLDENWKDDVIFPLLTQAELRRVFTASGVGAKVRLQMPMIIGRYRKNLRADIFYEQG